MQARLFITATLCCCLSCALFAQTRGFEAPDDVQERFHKDFSEANTADWEMLPGKRYVAKFVLNGYKMRATYSQVGLWMYTDIAVTESDIPADAMTHYRSTYGNSRITKTGFHDEPGESYYYIEIFRNGARRKLHYRETGEFIR